MGLSPILIIYVFFLVLAFGQLTDALGSRIETNLVFCNSFSCLNWRFHRTFREKPGRDVLLSLCPRAKKFSCPIAQVQCPFVPGQGQEQKPRDKLLCPGTFHKQELVMSEGYKFFIVFSQGKSMYGFNIYLSTLCWGRGPVQVMPVRLCLPYLSFQHVFCYIALCIAACLMLSIFTDGSSFLCVSYVSTHILLLFLGGWQAQFFRLHTDAGSLIRPLWFCRLVAMNFSDWNRFCHFVRFVIYCTAFGTVFFNFSPIQSSPNQV